MRFLLIAGVARSVVNFRGPLISALQNKGMEVHVAAPSLTNDSPYGCELKARGVHIHSISLDRTGVNPIGDMGAFVSLVRLMKAIRPEFVLGYTIKPVIYGALAAALVGVPRRFALVTGLGYAFSVTDEGGGLKRRLVRKLVKLLYRCALTNCEMTFFQNPDDEMLFRELKLITRAGGTRVVNGSGVDLDFFAVAPIPKRVCFLLIARLLRDKGVVEYVEAARVIRSKHPDVRFLLVGDLDKNPTSISSAELRVWVEEGVVEYLGRLADVRPAIAESSVYVLPSYREGTPRTVLEAMAMGRPIITTDAPGCRETVVHGENGFLVPVKAVDELVSAMLQFIERPALAGEMGERGRRLCEEKYDVNKVNRVMLSEFGFR